MKLNFTIAYLSFALLAYETTIPQKNYAPDSPYYAFDCVLYAV